jgi:RNA polymerase sigma factor (sigma-70 family)
MSQQGFDEFYAQTFSKVLSAVIMVAGHRGDAEDAVQDAYIKALHRWDQISGYDAPEAWVIKVAIRRLRKSRRRQRRREELSLEVTLPPASTPEQIAEAREVLGALATLSPGVRLAMVMCSVLGWKQEEAAEVLQVPRNTVGNRIFRGRAILRTKLGMTGPIPGSREPLLSAPRLQAQFPAVPEEDPLTAALIRTERWLRAGIEAEPETAGRIWARITAPEPGTPDGQPRRKAPQALADRTRGMARAIRRGKAGTAAEGKRSPR